METKLTIYFVSKITASFVAFLTTLYFARVLGAEVLGYYFLIIGIVSWLKIGGTMGIDTAVTKRLSEPNGDYGFVTSGAIILSVLMVVMTFFLLLFRSSVDSYVGYPATEYIVLMMIVGVAYTFVEAILRGENSVHFEGMLSPVKRISRSLIQISLILMGYNIIGLLFGYIIGGIIACAVGIIIISYKFVIPSINHFVSIWNYSKFSWLSSLKTQSFNWTDVLILGVFVSSAQVGIYSIAWSIVRILDIFGNAVSAAVFPEVSKHSMKNNEKIVSEYTTTSLLYAGLILIPGLFGGTIVGREILSLYGEEFSKGYYIFIILLFACLVYNYNKQILNILNAVDRPDLSFKINLLFISSNIILNILFIFLIGWHGAALATFTSATLGTAYSYVSLKSVIDFKIPTSNILYQFISASFMLILLLLIQYTITINNIILYLLFSIFIGILVYFVTLMILSPEIRSIVLDMRSFIN